MFHRPPRADLAIWALFLSVGVFTAKAGLVQFGWPGKGMPWSIVELVLGDGAAQFLACVGQDHDGLAESVLPSRAKTLQRATTEGLEHCDGRLMVWSLPIKRWPTQTFAQCSLNRCRPRVCHDSVSVGGGWLLQ